jgi:hypothetical protein
MTFSVWLAQEIEVSSEISNLKMFKQTAIT